MPSSPGARPPPDPMRTPPPARAVSSTTSASASSRLPAPASPAAPAAALRAQAQAATAASAAPSAAAALGPAPARPAGGSPPSGRASPSSSPSASAAAVAPPVPGRRLVLVAARGAAGAGGAPAEEAAESPPPHAQLLSARALGRRGGGGLGDAPSLALDAAAAAAGARAAPADQGMRPGAASEEAAGGGAPPAPAPPPPPPPPHRARRRADERDGEAELLLAAGRTPPRLVVAGGEAPPPARHRRESADSADASLHGSPPAAAMRGVAAHALPHAARAGLRSPGLAPVHAPPAGDEHWTRRSVVLGLAGLLLALNAAFWRNYLRTFAWGVVASVVVRSRTQRLAQDLDWLRAQATSGGRSSAELARSMLLGADSGGVLGLVFRHPVLALALALPACFLPPDPIVLLALGLGLVPCLLLVSRVADRSGATSLLLRRLGDPSLLSSLVLLCSLVLFASVVFGLLVASASEAVAVAAAASRWASSQLVELHQQSGSWPADGGGPAAGASVGGGGEGEGEGEGGRGPAALARVAGWAFHASESAFREQAWWPAVESVRTSLAARATPEEAVAAALDELKRAYAGAEWTQVVEAGVWAVVPSFSSSSSSAGGGAASAGARGARAARSLRERFTAGLLALTRLERFSELAMSAAWRLWGVAKDAVLGVSAFGGQIAVFFLVLDALCRSDYDVVEAVGLLLVPPEARERRRRFARDLEGALLEVFDKPIRSAHLNALVVLVVAVVAGHPTPFLATLATYAVSATRLVRDVETLVLAGVPWLAWVALQGAHGAQGAQGGQGATPAALAPGAERGAWAGWPGLWWQALRALAFCVGVVKLHAWGRAAASRRPPQYVLTESKGRIVSVPAPASVAGGVASGGGGLDGEGRDIVSPWLTDFAVGVAISQLGFDGILLGPVLVSVTVVGLKHIMEAARAADADAAAAAAAAAASDEAMLAAGGGGGDVPLRFLDDNSSGGSATPLSASASASTPSRVGDAWSRRPRRKPSFAVAPDGGMRHMAFGGAESVGGAANGPGRRASMPTSAPEWFYRGGGGRGYPSPPAGGGAFADAPVRMLAPGNGEAAAGNGAHREEESSDAGASAGASASASTLQGGARPRPSRVLI